MLWIAKGCLHIQVMPGSSHSSLQISNYPRNLAHGPRPTWLAAGVCEFETAGAICNHLTLTKYDDERLDPVLQNGTTGEFNAGNNYFTKYMAEVAALTTAGLRVDQGGGDNQRFRDRGWA